MLRLLVIFLVFSLNACSEQQAKLVEESQILRSDEPLTPEQEAFLKAYQHKDRKCNKCMANR